LYRGATVFVSQANKSMIFWIRDLKVLVLQFALDIAYYSLSQNILPDSAVSFNGNDRDASGSM
jgi:hypothetical protein